MLALQPPHKKRRLTRTASLNIYLYPDDPYRTSANNKPPFSSSSSSSSSSYSSSASSSSPDTSMRNCTPSPSPEPHLPTHLSPNTLLPSHPIPLVSDTTAYTSYLASLPPNVLFQTRIQATAAVRALYPCVRVGETVRLWYPDYRCFEGLMCGIMERLGVEREAVGRLKVVARKRGEVVWEGWVSAGVGEWERCLLGLEGCGVGERRGGGLGGADTVRLWVGLEGTM